VIAMSPEKLRVLRDVLQRAPVTLAEQLIVQEVVDQLLEMFDQAEKAPQTKTPSPQGNGVELVLVP
jgi:hypothetical protein